MMAASRGQSPMKRLLCIAVCCIGTVATAWGDDVWPYDPSPLLPFGAPNPAQTDVEARIFDSMIGVHDCRHVRTDYQTKEKTASNAVWTWYYDMNGFAIRDYYRFGDGAPVSLRIYNAESRNWHTWYFIGQGFYYVGEWVGGKQGDRLVFEKPDEEIGGRLFLSRLEYYDITEHSFRWKSTNYEKDSGESFVDWEITCQRRIGGAAYHSRTRSSGSR